MKKQIQKIKQQAHEFMKSKGNLPQRFTFSPIVLIQLCDLSLKQLDESKMKYCEKHDHYYLDYVPDCPICSGEKINIHNYSPDNIEVENKERKSKFKRKPQNPITKQKPIKCATGNGVEPPRGKITYIKDEPEKPKKKFKRKPKQKGFF